MGKTRRFLKLAGVLAVLAALAAARAAPAWAGPLAQHAFSLGELQADFKTLKQTILVWNPLAFTDAAQVRAVMDAQAAKLRDGMGELDFYRVLAPVVAATRCGHTNLRFSAAYDAYLRAQARYLPLKAGFIGARLFVVDPWGVPDLPAGAEITAIDGTPTAEILALMLGGISADGQNLTKKYAQANDAFNDMYLQLVESSERYTVEIVDSSDGARRSITAEGITKAAVRSRARPAAPPFSASFDAPDVATLAVRAFPYDAVSLAQYKSFLEDRFTSLRARNVSTLILDLRGNGGGDPWASSFLFTHLMAEPAPYFARGTPYYGALTEALPPAENAFHGRLLVLTDGTCFSSTGHLCSLLRFHGVGTFIGEETAGSFSCTDASQDFPLRASGFILHCSTREFHTAVTGFMRGRGVLPDFPIVPAIEDLVSGRDAVKDFALGHARTPPGAAP